MKRVQIRMLTLGDIPFAMKVKNIAGWNQTKEDWERYLAYEPSGCFLAEIDGEKAGTAMTITFGTRFGWIGMVLVLPSLRGLGVGTQLLHQAIDYLKVRQVNCMKLDATPMGKKVYVPLGFLEEYDIRRYERNAPFSLELTVKQMEYECVYPFSKERMADIIAFDEPYFGAERAVVLNGLWKSSEGCSLFTKDSRGITGYITARRGYEAIQIGSWVAANSETARKLLEALLAKIGNSKLYLDMPCPNEEGIRLVEEYGFRIQREFCRMYLGENSWPGNPAGIYGTSGAEKG